MMKVVKSFIAKKQREGGGFIVRRGMGGSEMSYLDPILMLDHLGPVVYGPGEAIGAPAHPHRGFTTVSLFISGGFQHKDSEGNKGNLGPGWVQWMDAAGGIIHSEMPTEELLEKGGKLEGFQLWVNLPAKNKMDAPAYQDVPPEEIPIVEKKNYSVRVVAGEYNGVPGAIVTKTPIQLLDVRFKPTDKDGEAVDFSVVADSITRDMNAMAYVYRGRIAFSDQPGKSHPEGSTVILGHTTDKPKTTAMSDARVSLLARSATEEVDDDGFTSRMLIIAGSPIKEPISRYGPFVMNTQDEIYQAFEDYQSGKLAKKAIEGAAEELAKTRKAKVAQLQSGAWKKDDKEII